MLNVSDLIVRVREKTDEENTTTVADSTIIRSLNEAQRNLVRIAARQYDQIFITNTTLTSDSDGFATIPEDAFDRRLEFLEIEVGQGITRKLLREKPGRVPDYRTSTSFQYPYAYTTTQNKIQLLPAPSGPITITAWYTKRPGSLGTSQGRILSIGSSTLVVDAVGSSIGTGVDDLSAFVTVVDSTTGLPKGSYQLASVDSTTNTLTIKESSLDRTAVAGNTLSTTLDSTIEQDDYVCVVGTTAVLELLSDYSDYIIQSAVVDIRRGLREETNPDYSYLKDLERELETLWSGRDLDARVTRRNPHWGRRGRSRRGRSSY